MIRLFFKLEKKLPIRNRVEKPVFIIGTGRSGTTILGVLLSMHRDVGFLNEPKALWNSIYPNEDLIGSYSMDDASYRLDATHVTSSIKQTAQRLFSFYLFLTRSSRLVDKYPELIFRVPFVREMFPDAKFLFLVRNGWDTCHSIEHWSHRLGTRKDNEVHDWWGVDRRKWNLLVEQLIPEHPDLAPQAEALHNWTNHTDMAAVEWVVTMREGIKLQQQYPANVMRVNYEELCHTPRVVLEEITDFLELASDDAPFLQYGEQTLKPAADKEPFPLNSAIETVFLDTMFQLGYMP